MSRRSLLLADHRYLRLTLAAAAVLWALALPLAALAAARSDSSISTANVLALAIYEVGSLICHQRPERSFYLGSAILPVCARCTGIYVGAALAAAMAIARIELGSVSRTPRPASSSRARLFLAVAAAPVLVTLAYEWITGRTPSNEVRAMSGACIGAAVAWVLIRLE
jgi:uncharacterized membrane protein